MPSTIGPTCSEGWPPLLIGEAMLAIVRANALREKFGGDSITEMRRNFDSYSNDLAKY
jgi:chorismate synthase